VNELLKACAAHAGGQPTDGLRRLTSQFLRRSRDDPSAIAEAAEALRTLPPQGAAFLAVAIGAAVEGGSNADLSARAIVDLLLSWLPQLPIAEGEEAEQYTPTADEVNLLDAFKSLALSVVAHLARAPHLRATLAEDLTLLDRLAVLEAYSAGAAWIREMLLRISGSLILLHVPSGRGFQLQFRNIATCFHLFSLIQVAIGEQLPGGRKPDPIVAAAARGRTKDKVNDEAWWHYGDPRAAKADLRHAIWGEALVREVPVIEGHRVMLLWPAILQGRAWDSGFFGPQLDALMPDVTLESELSTADCAAWFRTLGVRRADRKWWQLW
jgi:hypothetical protein